MASADDGRGGRLTNGAGHFTEEDYEKVDAEDHSKLMDYPDDVDYYSLLGLSRSPQPTDAQIRSAYRTLTLSFHPDKQPAHLREAAEAHFEKIKEAYETLIDPKKRTVYDLAGAEGVRREWSAGGTMGRGGAAEDKQVGIKAMDAEQFRQWFLNTMKARERTVLDQLVHARVSIRFSPQDHSFRCFCSRPWSLCLL
jgi:DnaJ family protein C protein 11